MLNEELNERERNILRYVIQQFILTASPVGSRNITRKYELGISPATVRNIMADLEESGFINHPHTSAGRIPTDKGYRFYVDTLMELQKLGNTEKGIINKELNGSPIETDNLLKITSHILSSITKQLACVSYPNFETGILEKIQLVSLTSTRLLIVISIKSGFLKTITLEMSSELKNSQLETVQALLNERLGGLNFKEIRNTFSERFKDIEEEHQPVIRLFIDSADKIFKDVKRTDKLVITGAKNVLQHPEFEDPQRFQSVIELMEDKDVIIHILDKSNEVLKDEVFISIGSENKNVRLNEYSFISKDYKIGGISGTLGVIGPKRMDYSKVVAIVDYMSKILTEFLTNSN